VIPWEIRETAEQVWKTNYKITKWEKESKECATWERVTLKHRLEKEVLSHKYMSQKHGSEQNREEDQQNQELEILEQELTDNQATYRVCVRVCLY
jgi:wobble nucleotide-excising tRNase